MNNLSTIQLELFLKKKYVHIFPDTEDVSKSIDRIRKYAKNENDFLIYVFQEIIPFQEYFDKIINLVESLPNNIWIMSSTASPHPLFVTPLLNTLMFKDDKRLNDIDKDGNDWVLYFDEKVLTPCEKIFESILSVVNPNKQREYLFNNIKPHTLHIQRYYNNNTNTTYPTWSELTQEYLRTYLACVVETNYPSTTSFNCMTEKTLLSFFCRCIPLVLGKKYIVRDLKDMGFWIANESLGFGDADTYEDDDIKKVDYYIKCIERINNIDVKEFYYDNIENINNNYKIISEIYSKKLTKRLV